MEDFEVEKTEKDFIVKKTKQEKVEVQRDDFKDDISWIFPWIEKGKYKRIRKRKK